MISNIIAKGYRFVVFDYDSTIARVPIDWARAREECRTYLTSEFSDLCLENQARVDEMEFAAILHSPDQANRIFDFRRRIESHLDGAHVPIDKTCRLIDDLVDLDGVKLFIVSNNLHQTVAGGLKQIGILNHFGRILGIDDVGEPKPSTRAFEILSEEHGCLVQDCLFVGDNQRTDGEFCRLLGMDFYNISNS